MVATQLLDPIFKNYYYVEDDNFSNKPMEHWDSKDVCSFLKNSILENIEGFENISKISGITFKVLSVDMFQKMVNNERLAHKIYDAKESFLRNLEKNNNNNNNLFTLDKNLNDVTSTHFGYNDIYNSESDLCIEEMFEEEYKEVRNYDADKLSNNYNNVLDYVDNRPVKPRKPGRPRTHPLVSKKCGLKKEKLWEFLIHLLHDPKSCPSLICWEDYHQGTFRFVQNEQVAKIWGGRKKNQNMTYDKFSRAMRYYYKSKILLPVRGQRLVYKFGPQAKGWKMESSENY
ncbi:unnamed protein product [Brassicogethes aeneus]|uniref:ETS domain-containing protein n=1 Tax=Brassicogethes aeneus TaxID=1431903 RepID=A0A9P0BCE0_BRAAE|nr:unnamed protein product [Brassicogethes aeneus]